MIMYKLNENSIQRLSDNAFIPQVEGNRDYQQFLQDVKSQGLSIVEGADVVEPDYVTLRTGPDGYASTGEQFGMQTDGTWDAHVADVKARFPKTITGGTTIADLPEWVEVEVEALRFREQLAAYTQATTRLEQYILADGREEVTEMQNTIEYVLDDDDMIVVDEEGNPTFMQEEVVVISSIEPLEPTVEITEYDDDDMGAEPTVLTIENPKITQDNLERSNAQDIIDITPNNVKLF
jgi:hypothetical protein